MRTIRFIPLLCIYVRYNSQRSKINRFRPLAAVCRSRGTRVSTHTRVRACTSYHDRVRRPSLPRRRSGVLARETRARANDPRPVCGETYSRERCYVIRRPLLSEWLLRPPGWSDIDHVVSLRFPRLVIGCIINLFRWRTIIDFSDEQLLVVFISCRIHDETF